MSFFRNLFNRSSSPTDSAGSVREAADLMEEEGAAGIDAATVAGLAAAVEESTAALGSVGDLQALVMESAATDQAESQPREPYQDPAGGTSELSDRQNAEAGGDEGGTSTDATGTSSQMTEEEIEDAAEEAENSTGPADSDKGDDDRQGGSIWEGPGGTAPSPLPAGGLNAPLEEVSAVNADELVVIANAPESTEITDGTSSTMTQNDLGNAVDLRLSGQGETQPTGGQTPPGGGTPQPPQGMAGDLRLSGQGETQPTGGQTPPGGGTPQPPQGSLVESETLEPLQVSTSSFVEQDSITVGTLGGAADLDVDDLELGADDLDISDV